MAIPEMVFTEQDLKKLEEIGNAELSAAPKAKDRDIEPLLGDEELEVPDLEH